MFIIFVNTAVVLMIIISKKRDIMIDHIYPPPFIFTSLYFHILLKKGKSIQWFLTNKSQLFLGTDEMFFTFVLL